MKVEDHTISDLDNVPNKEISSIKSFMLAKMKCCGVSLFTRAAVTTTCVFGWEIDLVRFAVTKVLL